MALAVVTGGGGFLGSAIVRAWLADGNRVRSFSRQRYRCLEEWGVEQIQGDLANGQAVSKAIKGSDLVFHCAAKAGVWGPAEVYERANVLGTKNVIAACKLHNVEKLVFTSSPSVVFAGTDQAGVDESVPYPKRFLAHYPRTKAKAEAMVNLANSEDLATVSLRPHLIWGPGDPHLVPRLIEKARLGRLRLVGDQDGLVDSVYVDNAAQAHVMAAKHLQFDSALGGKNYFITNGEPCTMAELINGILATAGLLPIEKRVSGKMAYTAGAFFEMLYRCVGAKKEPPMTRFVARQLATAHWFDISAAQRDFDYQPLVSHREGLQRLRAWFQDHPQF